jgi:ABC-2 type transport system ATP-binding protein
VIGFQNVSLQSHTHEPILDDVSCQFQRGRVTAVLSSSRVVLDGIIGILLGLRAPSGGEVTVNGINPATNGLAVRRQITFVADRLPVRGHLSALANAKLLLALSGTAGSSVQLRTALRHSDLSDRSIEQNARSLDSFQRFGIWLAVHHLRRTELLLLDTSAGTLASRALDLSFLLREAAADNRFVVVCGSDRDFAERVSHDLFRVQNHDLVLAATDGLVRPDSLPEDQ